LLADAGLSVEEPDDLLPWIMKSEPSAVLITLQTAEDWALLRQAATIAANLLLIALLTETGADAYVRAVNSGAIAAVPRSAPTDAIMEVLVTAMKGKSVLPVEVVRALAADVHDRSPTELSSREISWLQALSQGITVARLGEQAGYSERAMYRLLRQLYRRIEVSNRIEAISKASRQGWL
jgi:DNA-binding NarL/FixJ family response regulator